MDCVENNISLRRLVIEHFIIKQKKFVSKLLKINMKKTLPRYKLIEFNISVKEIKKLYKLHNVNKIF